MPTKTDNILSYLPGTYRALPRPTALYSVADAFGNELLQAENTLMAVMRSHWVDTADQGEDIIKDLGNPASLLQTANSQTPKPGIASLYGLAPRDDEDVEEFRAHLKRYVRTFLEGTPTVQGILRLVADALGLIIADSYNQMDTWWTRSDDSLTTIEPQRNDAATLLFGSDAVSAFGSPAQAARISGSVDLSGGADLRAASILSLKVDAASPVVFDLAPAVANKASATLAEIVKTINDKLAAQVDTQDGHHLILTSPTIGASSKLAILDVAGDAAPRLFGLAPRAYNSSVADSAHVTGAVDLSGGVDLSKQRYLRLLIDGTHLAEVDCAGPNAAATTLAQIVTSINASLGLTVASHDGHFITLTSPTNGFSSTIQFQPPAAQDATQLIFGPVAPTYIGRSQQPGRVTGTSDLSHGVDLSERFNIAVSLDGGPPLVVNCAGAIPAATSAPEIAAAINSAAGKQVASQNGAFITLTASTPGGAIAFSRPPNADATMDIFGIAPRDASGNAATVARIAGPAIAGGAVNLSAVHLLQVAVDGGPSVIVDFWKGIADPSAATLAQVAAAVNAALGSAVASQDGQRLVLTSPTMGAAGSVAITPLTVARTRRFVTRAFIMNEAAQNVLGISRQQAFGTTSTAARVEGTVDLSRGVDLRDDPFLALSVNGAPTVQIDCSAGVPRPRVALPGEIVTAINKAIDPTGGLQVASHDGKHLFFTSPVSGSASSIVFQPVLAGDASATLGLQPAVLFGRDATRVTFQGVVDLSSSVDLSAAHKVKIAMDGAAPVEIECAGKDPAHTTLNELITLINTALNSSIAVPVGKTMVLTSPTKGSNSKIEFLVPSSADATKAIFGISPRAYHGADAVPPQITGQHDLSGGVDLRVARFLRLGIDGGPLVEVDCSLGAADPSSVKLGEIMAAINKTVNQTVASSLDGKHLTLASPTAGASAKLVVDTHSSLGAFQRLMGDASQMTQGSAPAPATITGTVNLLAGTNLLERRILRLAVDGSRPVDIDISGAAPDKTFLDEIVAKINAAFPGVASATSDDHLLLTSPTAGERSSIEVLPVRVLELLEFPAVAATDTHSLKHGDKWTMNNSGAADSELQIEINTPQGEAGIELVNRTRGMRVRCLAAVPVGGALRLRRDKRAGLKAEITHPDGTVSPVPGSRILAGPLGSQAWVPFSGVWNLTGGDTDNWASLQLNNPQTAEITVLRALRRGVQGDNIAVTVSRAAFPPIVAVVPDGGLATLVGRLHLEAGVYSLRDGGNGTLAILRAGQSASFHRDLDHVVVVRGNFYPGEGTSPVMVVDSIAALFDVAVQGSADDGSAVLETYTAVSIGMGLSERESLGRKILAKPSALVFAEELSKAAVLALPTGRSEWSYLTGDEDRFNQAHFDGARFAGGPCFESAVFNVSRFSNMPPEVEAAVFGPVFDVPVQANFRWTKHQPGAFVVNLPADLPENFGARFNQARFGRSADAPESIQGVGDHLGPVVMEPASDPDFIVTRINAQSTLVQAAVVPRVPLGWEAMIMPFHHPRARALSGAGDATQAAIYLAEAGVPGFVELRARDSGTWGNSIQVTARKNSPGRFDVTIGYDGARFENARQTAFAGRVLAPGEDPLPALTAEILKPRPVGELQGKAAGVLAQVTRYQTESEERS